VRIKATALNRADLAFDRTVQTSGSSGVERDANLRPLAVVIEARFCEDRVCERDDQTRNRCKSRENGQTRTTCENTLHLKVLSLIYSTQASSNLGDSEHA